MLTWHSTKQKRNNNDIIKTLHLSVYRILPTAIPQGHLRAQAFVGNNPGDPSGALSHPKASCTVMKHPEKLMQIETFSHSLEGK